MREDKMNIVTVTTSEDGKWKVLHNYIQQGINYTDEILANKYADELKKKMGIKK